MAVEIKRIETQSMLKRLLPYSQPYINTFVGIIVAIINGAVFPVFGIFITNMLFSLMDTRMDVLRSESDKWCLGMLICSLVSFIAMSVGKSLFGVVGENLTKGVRQELYKSLVTKNVGWFDLKENAPGILTSSLASDVQSLNGASTEGISVILESCFAILVGIALGFYYSWMLSLVALACVPFMMLGGSINAKFQAGMSNVDEGAYKNANLLAGDAILHYRTVASFANDDKLVAKYDEYITGPAKTNIKKAHCIGISFGFSQFV